MILIVLLVAPSPVAERYTSSTQDGQFIVHPIRSYGFVITLARTSGSAVLSNPGEALEEAKKVFVDSGSRPVRVALLYLPARDTYTYVRKTGKALTIVAPPKLVWEIWARVADSSSPQTMTTDVVGFLDYASGRRIGFADRLADRLPGGAGARADGEPSTPFESRP